MTPIIGVPLLLLYFAAITWVPIQGCAKLIRPNGAFVGLVFSLILWGVTIGILMSADPNFGHRA